MSIDHLLNICFLILFLSLLVGGPCYLSWKRKTMGRILYHLSIPRFHKVFLGVVIVLWVGVILVQIVLVVNNGWQSSSKLWPMLGLTLPLSSLFSLNRFEIEKRASILRDALRSGKTYTPSNGKRKEIINSALGKRRISSAYTCQGTGSHGGLSGINFNRINAKTLISYYPNTSRKRLDVPYCVLCTFFLHEPPFYYVYMICCHCSS